jgi:hypothetical protein
MDSLLLELTVDHWMDSECCGYGISMQTFTRMQCMRSMKEENRQSVLKARSESPSGGLVCAALPPFATPNHDPQRKGKPR